MTDQQAIERASLFTLSKVENPCRTLRRTDQTPVVKDRPSCRIKNRLQGSKERSRDSVERLLQLSR